MQKSGQGPQAGRAPAHCGEHASGHLKSGLHPLGHTVQVLAPMQAVKQVLGHVTPGLVAITDVVRIIAAWLHPGGHRIQLVWPLKQKLTQVLGQTIALPSNAIVIATV